MGFPRGDAGEAGLAPGTAPATGDARVDEALSRLADLSGLPVAEHPAVFEYVHERLAETLGDLDAAGHGADAAGHGADAARHGPAAGQAG